MTTEKELVDFLKEPSEGIRPEEVVSAVRDSAEDLLGRAHDAARPALDAARDGAQRAYDRSQDFDPFAVAVIAVGVGLVIGYMLGRER